MIERLRWGLLLVIVFGVGCVPKPPLMVSSYSGEELLGRLLHAGRERSGLAATAGLEVTSPEGGQRSTQLLLVSYPDRFRADLLSPFGNPLISLASDGSKFAVAWPARGRYYRGTARPEYLQRFLRMPLTVEQLVGLLLQRIPLLEAAEISAETDAAGFPRLLLAKGEQRQKVQFDQQLRPLRSDYYIADELWLTVEYGDFQPAQKQQPQMISISLPAEGRALQVRLRDLEVNPELKETVFGLRFPPGAAIEPLP